MAPPKQPSPDVNDDDLSDIGSNDSFDSLIDDDLGNEFYEHDDPDDDPDYSDDNDFGHDDNIGDNDDDIPIDPALLGELDNLETFEPAEEDSESENETQLAADSALQTFHHDLKAAGGFKKARNGRLPQAGGNRGGGRRAVGESTVSFEVSSMLGDANMCFVSGDLDGALAVVKKIIRIEAGVFAAWKLMGEIHREKGETKNCLLAFLTAAHTKPKEAELWVECAKMTMQLGEEEAAMGAGESSIKVFGKGGYKEQAIYCYSRAIASNPDDFDAIHERARLYWQIEQFKKAAEGLLMLYKVMPEDLSILKELARLYTDMGEEKIEEAADLYRKAIDKFVKKGNKNCVVGWSEINIFAELHIMANQYKEAIYVVRHYGRWLLGRAEEDFWDALDDDREWNTSDPKRDEVPEYDPDRFAPETYGLVHELRVKLGVCRLRLGQPELAKAHFQIIYELDTQEYYDLFQVIGDELYKSGDHEEAVFYYFKAIDGEPQMDKKLWFNLADCYKTLRKVGDAESCYNSILEVYEDDTDAMLQLAQIMEMDGRKAEALDLVNEVLRIRKEAYYAPPLEVANDPKSRRNARRARNNRNKERLTQAEKQVINERRTQQTTAKFNKLSLLLPAQLAGDKKAINEFLDTAAELVDDFRNTKALYPDERGKPFTGYIPTAGRRAAAEAQEIQLKRMAHRLQESLTYDAAPEVTEPEATEFRGLNFDDWLWVFCQYALALARYADVRDAYDVCAAAKEANVFYRSKNILTIIWSTWLSCAILKEDSESVSTILRLFLTKYQFQNESYNLFTACLTASRHANDVFHSAANLKYLLRHIKLLDSCLSGQHRANAAHLTNIDPETDKEFVPKDFDIALITLYGHMLSAGKSYISALHYYTRAYAMNPLDPLIRFCIALCYLQRSMQRQSENRTWQVAQATVFLKLYEEARLGLPGVVYRKQTEEGNAPQDVTGLISDKEKKRREMFRQEVEYNFGRAWMMYGLTHLAIPRFENVLKIGEEQAARRKERDDKRKQKEAEKGDVMDVDSLTPDSIIKNGGDMMNVDPKPNQEEVEEQDLGILDEEEDLSLDAAYNLQMMYITNGAEELAMEVTEKYLVI